MAERFIVVDQRLRDFVGHHHDYSAAIVRAAVARGWSVGVAAHRDFAGSSLGGAPVLGRFAPTMGAPQRRLREGARRMLAQMPRAARTRLLARLPSPAAARTIAPTANPGFGRELLALLSGLALGPRDHVLVHTLEASEFLGLAALLRHQPPLAATLHIVLRYDGVAVEREAFEAIATAKHPVRYWTDTEPLASQYRELGCAEIGVLPIPHGLTALPQRTAALRHPLTLGYLGGARGDKGFHLLPDLVDEFVADGTAPDRGRFLIQATFGISREEGSMEAALRRLKRHQHRCVELIETPPDAVGFQRALMATDILLLPYDRDVYRRRSSNLLAQAIALGIPTVVPADTWLSSVAPQGAHVAFGRPSAWTAAVRQAVGSIQDLEAAACAAAGHARSSDGPDTLIARLTS